MVTMDHMPVQHPLGSLKRLLLAYELALLLLVVVTGVLGGLWAYFWSQTTRVRKHGLDETPDDGGSGS